MIPDRAVTAVIPNWNGRRWLPACLRSLDGQTLPFAEVIVVDNGSTDGSLPYLRAEHPDVRVLALAHNTGFAFACNRGIELARTGRVALLNTDVVLDPEWLARMSAALDADPQAAAVTGKMLSLDDPELVYDAGDILRRDGACEQRGRFERDDGRWELPGEVWGACAGAALYRRAPLLALGGFDERLFAYLEDVELALRLRLAGWRCRYEPAVALHAAEGSSAALPGGHWFYVARNTVVIVARSFPVRWLPLVAYRQLSWLRQAHREGRLGWHLRGLAAAVPRLPGAIAERRALRAGAQVPIEVAIPPRPIRRAR